MDGKNTGLGMLEQRWGKTTWDVVRGEDERPARKADNTKIVALLRGSGQGRRLRLGRRTVPDRADHAASWRRSPAPALSVL